MNFVLYGVVSVPQSGS